MNTMRNTGWNRNIKWDWVVVDAGGLVVYGSDLASECLAYLDR